MLCEKCGYLTNRNPNLLTEENYCCKLGCRIKYVGCCEDGDDMPKRYKKARRRKYNHYERKLRYKRKLERIVEATNRYPSGAYRIGADGEWTDKKDDTIFIKRCYRANHAPGHAGFLKKMSSRKFRRYRGELANGCAYKKTFDFWWELT